MVCKMKKTLFFLVLNSMLIWGQYQILTEVNQLKNLKTEVQSKLFSGLLLKNVIEKNKSFLNNEISKDEAAENIIIYYKQKPTNKEISELLEIGIKPYINTWTPPLANHPYGFIIATMPTDKFLSLLSIESVIKVSTAEHQHYSNNNYSTSQIKANNVWAQGFTGTGVKVAILDSGLDSFYEGSDLPNNYQRRDYSNYPTSIDDNCENTVSGHGTHVTGSVLGRGILSSGHNSNNGNQPFKGSAPDASLAFLKIGNDINASASGSAIIAAVHSAVDTFNAKIISMSYGGWYDHHDGSSATEQKFDWAFNQGVLCFVSAGNEAARKRHFNGTVNANDSTGFIQFNVTSSVKPTFNLVYYDGSTRSFLKLKYYDASFNQITSIDSFTTTESSRGTESQYYQAQNNFTSGTYYLKVFNNTNQSVNFHIYAFHSSGYTFQNDDPYYTIGQPSSADSVIAVGAYVSRKQWWDYQNNGPYSFSGQNNQYEIANFSSLGPRVDNVIKPNITAPGTAIISLRDTDVLTSPDALWIDNDGINGGATNYYVMQGTSMACPIAAGAAALFYHKYPSATPSQVKSALQNYASKSITESYPNNKWGFGKLDIYAATNSLPTIDGYLSESNYDIIGVFSSGRNGFGNDNDLGVIKYYADGTDIYLGITGEITSNDNIILFFNFSGYNGRGSNTLNNGATDAGVFKYIGGAKMDFDVDFALAFNEGNSSTNFYIDACRYGSGTPVISTGFLGNIGNQLGGTATFNISSVFGGTGNMTIAYRNNFSTDSFSGIEMKIPISAFAGVNNTNNLQLFAIITNNGGSFSNECIPGDPGASNPGNNPDFSVMTGGPFHTNNHPLPIELNKFTAEQKNNEIILRWETLTEVNSFGFEIEKNTENNYSTSNNEWSKIGFVAGNGNSNSPKEYFFIDRLSNKSKLKYRLKLIDADGSFSYSPEIEIEVKIPTEFVLYQNYPNPFSAQGGSASSGNPGTTITWQSPVGSWQTIKLYNSLGEEIETIVEGYYEAGKHSTFYILNSTLPSGVYFYQLRAGDYIQTQKMILMR